MNLYVTHCGAKKNCGTLGPQDMYTSPRIQRFVLRCESRCRPWAILSAKYGLFFPDERRPDYDVRLKRRQQNSGYLFSIRVEENGKPLSREESNTHMVSLAGDIRRQLRARKIDQIIFYIDGRRPDAYVALLHHAVDECDSLPAGQAHLEPHLDTCTNAGAIRLIRELDLID